MTGSIVNTHWFGGINNIPPEIKYIGRPGPYGNKHSSKNGELAKEECVAFNRVDLYLQLIDEPDYFQKIKQDLDGRDLACWCAVKNKHVACHGLNYLHVFSLPHRNRLYDKTVYDYLIEDLTIVMAGLKSLSDNQIPLEKSLDWYIAFNEVRIEINEIFRLFTVRETESYMRCLWVSTLIIDLELALADPDIQMRLYRLDRVVWNTFRFTCRPNSREGEPSLPGTKVRKPKSKKEKI